MAVYETEVNRRPITRQVLTSLVHLLESEGLRKAPKLGPAIERVCFQVRCRGEVGPPKRACRLLTSLVVRLWFCDNCAGTGCAALLPLGGRQQHGPDASAPPARGGGAVPHPAAVPPPRGRAVRAVAGRPVHARTPTLTRAMSAGAVVMHRGQDGQPKLAGPAPDQPARSGMVAAGHRHAAAAAQHARRRVRRRLRRRGPERVRAMWNRAGRPWSAFGR